MKKYMSKIFAVASSAALQLGAMADGKDPFVQHVHSQVVRAIEHAETVPGLQSEVFKTIKPGIILYWNELVNNEILEVSAADAEVRPYFVAIQALVEHVFSCEQGKSVKSLVGVIHTPMPATPLCTTGTISPGLVAASIEEDPARLFTVESRTTIIRNFLAQNGELYVVYPEKGFTERTEAQQKIYNDELTNYPLNLFDRPLKCESIENELIGAVYIVENQIGKKFAFAIKITQANDPKDIGHFGLWFGELENSPVSDRIETVLKAMREYSAEPIAPSI
jgi:hypothetical protein